MPPATDWGLYSAGKGYIYIIISSSYGKREVTVVGLALVWDNCAAHQCSLKISTNAVKSPREEIMLQ